MKPRFEFDIEDLKTRYSYDHLTGTLSAKNASNRKDVGDSIGSTFPIRYNTTYYKGKTHYIHRIIWCLYYGEQPPRYIDHIDGISQNNKIHNLRKATNQENAANSKIRSSNTSGYQGVSYDKNRDKWTAKIRFNYKTVNLGRFDDIEEAALAYNRKAVELFGEFARVNDVAS